MILLHASSYLCHCMVEQCTTTSESIQSSFEVKQFLLPFLESYEPLYHIFLGLPDLSLTIPVTCHF